MRATTYQDQGAALIGYALVVLLVGIVAMVGVTSVGAETSESFSEIPQAFNGDGPAAEDESGLTPDEKWEQAQADHSQAMQDASDQFQADQAAGDPDAKATFDAAKAQAKAEFDAAKAEYQASK